MTEQSQASRHSYTPGLVSTIIPVYNRAGLLREAVQSVLAQSHRPIEILIVNDGSTDTTAAVAEGLAAEHPQLIRVLHQDNAGPGVARQRALAEARGEYIQFLDSDDLLLSSKFERQIALLLENPDCQVCYGISHQQDLGDTPVLHPEPLKGTGQPRSQLFPLLLVERWWSTHTPLYRHSALHGLGPWKPWINEEDWEYEARLAATGARLIWLPESVSLTRRDPQEQHLSHDGSSQPRKLAHRALARWSIYRSALAAGLSHDLPEMREFARYSFLLCRQCAQAGLPDQAASLHDLASQAARCDPRLQGDLRLFGLLAQAVGWRRASIWSERLNRWRPSRRQSHGRS
ncbi:MAG: glycosyltransferase family A protein [Synechococcaceae cyanobacterium]|nr:glycosyltransferase family A protein [Synechococcaceae cyanobacterium]